MIPIEMLSMLAGGISGAVFKYMGIMAEAKKVQAEAFMQRVDKEHEIRKDLMEGPKRGNKEFQFTKRIIALSVVFSVIVLPKLAALFNDAPQVVYGQMQEGSTFLWFTTANSINWVVANGLVITPVDVHATLAIISMYFGQSIVGNSK